MMRVARTGWMTAALAACWVAIATAQDSAPPRIRSGSPGVAAVIAEGVHRSATFSRLVERLEQSDLVVYVNLEFTLPRGLGGRTLFVSRAGGHRYVWVGICACLSASQRIAMAAHELQHALEIADAPQVVDIRSLAVFYRRIGLRRGMYRNECYESEAAMRTERQVSQDLQRRHQADAQD